MKKTKDSERNFVISNENYLNYILEKISKLGYRYISDEEKINLEKISSGRPVRVPKNYENLNIRTPKPTPLSPFN